MLKCFLASLATLAFSCHVSLAQQMQEQDPDIILGRLDNGLTYIIRHNELPKDVACFYIAQRVGAILEEDDQNGLAHFLEHMAFNGTKNFPDKGIINFLERVGVRFGADINAYTAEDETVYNLDNVPVTDPAIVDSALLVLHDWSGFLSLDGDEIDKERGVIREEWRTRASASSRLYYGHIRNTMPGSQYAKRDVIGDTAIINNFSYDALRAYYKKWYRPDLQGIVIVGDVDPRDIEAKIKNLWADIPAPAPDAAERVYYDVPLNSKPIVSILTDDEARATSCQIQFRHLPLPAEVRNRQEHYRTILIESLCQRIMNSRFADLALEGAPYYNAAIADGELTQTLSAFILYFTAKDGQTAKSLDVALSELERLRRFGVSQAELDRERTKLQKTWDNRFEARNKTQTGTFVRNYYSCFLSGSTITSTEYDHKMISFYLPTITTQDILDYLHDRLDGIEPVFQISALPADPDILQPDQYVDAYRALASRDVQPRDDQAVASSIVDFNPTPGSIKKHGHDKKFDCDYVVLSNGVTVYLKPTTLSDNEVLFRGWCKGGFSSIDASRVISADCSASIMNNMGFGANKLADFRKIMAGKSASMSASPDTYVDQVSGQSSKNLSDIETALQILHLCFLPRPVDSQAYDAYVDRIRTYLANARKDPRFVFSDTISVISSAGNPYAASLRNVDDLRLLNLDDAVKVYNDRFSSAKGFSFAIVGSFQVDSVLPLVSKWIGSLPVGPKSLKMVDRQSPAVDSYCSFSQKMTTNKTSVYIRFANQSKKLARNECIALSALARVLSMRYLESVREDEGGSYGVGVSGGASNFLQPHFSLSINFDTDPAAFDKLRPIIDKEIQLIADNGPRADDLDKVKKNLIKSRVEGLQRNSTWVALIENSVIYDVWDDDYEALIQSISAADLQAWAKRILSDAKKLEVVMNPQD